MLDKELIVLGKIVSVHGLQGAVKVYSFTDPIENILTYKEWILRKADEKFTVKLEQGRLQGKVLVAQLKNLTDREEARKLADYEICIPFDRLPVLESSEYYWHQLVGLKVINLQEQLLGNIDHLLETGANDVLVVKSTAESIDDKERLLPYIDQCVLSIDLNVGEVKVDWDAEF